MINPSVLCHGDSQVSTFEVAGVDGFESQLAWRFDDTSHLPPANRHDSRFVNGSRGVRVQVSAPTKGNLVGMIVALPEHEIVSDAARLRIDVPAVDIVTAKVNPRVLASDENAPSTYAIDPAKIPADVAMASKIWMQACIKIEMVTQESQSPRSESSSFPITSKSKENQPGLADVLPEELDVLWYCRGL
ncbi:hypothetical protein HPC50_00620 [Corallococcus exiguus]|uniref:hypothetical protein n=1 Tax=Corallococcus TaxID=83461 RepID=UPI0011C44BEF|nr:MULTISPECIES: hypothetical protein [Corallococcus]NNB85336.1 hypothetical protein [Corallococcus exiguus]NPC45578.1 hypothetical protein [Corallococcus exiguus]